jgi:hypothetical protein
MKIIDNFLNKEDFKLLQDNILTYNFPWYFNNGVNAIGDEYFQFTHNFYKKFHVTSHLYNLIEPLIKKINPLSLIRIKANLITRTLKIIEHGMHIDQSGNKIPKSKTAIFYCNNNNGYTKFENGDKVKSVENRIVVFNNSLYHSGSSCTDEKIRVVININYFPK